MANAIATIFFLPKPAFATQVAGAGLVCSKLNVTKEARITLLT
jgi:hypothetical protein